MVKAILKRTTVFPQGQENKRTHIKTSKMTSKLNMSSYNETFQITSLPSHNPKSSHDP